ncbi:MAG: radical SAM protein [Myxococcales bacterium]|nr:radical SAM protein [Myxococcales bacterium]
MTGLRTHPAIVLVHPPLADPTQPYPSLPTLAGWLDAHGIATRVVDLNVEAAHWLWDAARVEALATRMSERILALDAMDALDFESQRELAALGAARSAMKAVLSADPSPIDVFRDRERFYDPLAYSWARLRSDALFEALSAAHFPFRYGWNHVVHHTVPWSFDLLATYARERLGPFDGLYDGFARCLSADVRLVGISIVFPSQFPEAVALAGALRRLRPDVLLLFGGPALHQVAVHMTPAEQRRLLEHVDALGIFEGEKTLEALAGLLESLPPDGPERAAALKTVPNLISRGAGDSLDTVQAGPRWTLDVRESPAPRFDDLDLDAYLAPERTLLYAPTRGCYWGKCSFCYYGLAETATATYREIAPEVAAAQLEALCQKHDTRHVYLSCDVLSPSYAVRFADALLARDLRITWSSDLKIEKYFTPERCERLKAAGLAAAAFGIESGSDRILSLIRKGTDRDTLTRVNRAFAAAGIATEWMTFTDHPTENVDEALETVAWIDAEKAHVSLFIVGRFGLERGSAIAQNPAAYGIDQVYFARGDDLRLYAQYTETVPSRSADDTARIDADVNRISAEFALHPYPWAGANSTHHTLLHLARFGPDAFKTHFQRAGDLRHALPRPPKTTLKGLEKRLRYDLDATLETEAHFTRAYLDRSLYSTVKGSGGLVAPLSLEDYQEAARAVPHARPVAR